MDKELVLASAGAGKSQLIAKQSFDKSKQGGAVLVLTYTENNQKELVSKICQINGCKPAGILVKGWFTFLLEDIIRPYQRYIFEKRISTINFNKAGDPHKSKGKTIPGRSQKLSDGTYNPIYYLTKCETKAHTTYLSNLAFRIIEESKGKTVQRITEIYDAIFIDEIQDLVGYDFDIIEAISKSNLDKFICVGDFRQTVYTTSVASKHPKTNLEKITRFAELDFIPKNLNISWRCIQSICDFSDLIFADEDVYEKTISKVKDIPAKFMKHCGVFVVHSDDIIKYIKRYNPVIIRWDRRTEATLCDGLNAYNFGEAKGLGFDRILIIPTDSYKSFLAGETKSLNTGKTNEPKNKLYVGVTRARYSAAFLYDGKIGLKFIENWVP